MKNKPALMPIQQTDADQGSDYSESCILFLTVFMTSHCQVTAGQQHTDKYFIKKGAYGLSYLCLHGKEGYVCK